MWRAFFYATGIMLILLGLECIFIGRFAISKQSAISRVAKKFFGHEAGMNHPDVPGMAYGYGSNKSSFGASRFNDNPFSVTTTNRNRNNPYNLASQQSPLPGVSASSPGRIIQTEDWMPWSLIAAGVIVTLYTHSLRPGYPSS